MPDDTYTTLLNFVSETESADKNIKKLSASMKQMEVQADKMSKTDIIPDLSDARNGMNGYVSEFSKMVDKVISEAKAAGIKVRDNLAAEVKSGGLYGEARMEFEKLLNTTNRLSREAVKRSPIPEATQEQLQAINPQILSTARELEKTGKQLGVTFSRTFNQLIAEGYAAGQAIKRLDLDISLAKQQSEQFAAADAKAVAEQIAQHRMLAILYSKEASILRKTASDIREQASILRGRSQQIQGVSQLGLGIGTGIVGGIFAYAQKYINDIRKNGGEVTATILKWNAAQETLAKSGEKVGAVFAEKALPLLELAASTAQKAAGFVEKHPELVQAAINTGLVVAGLGAVGLAVSKGIKLYADQLYLSAIPLQLEAGKLQFAAAQQQLIAARMKSVNVPGIPQSASGGIATATTAGKLGSSVLGGLAKVTLIASAVIIGAELGNALGNAIAKMIDPNVKDTTLKETLFYGGVRAVEALQQKLDHLLQTLASKLPQMLSLPIQIFTQWDLTKRIPAVDAFFKRLLLGADQLEEASSKLSGVQSSPQFEAVLKAYESYKQQDLELVQKHYQERQDVVRDSMAAEAKANRDYANRSAQIGAQSGKALANATRSYEEESKKSEQQNATERARIIRDGGIEIQRIEQDAQERLRKLRLEHEDRVAEFTASRDALGLAKEQRDYNRSRNEEIRQTNLEIGQRRQDIALRLRDLQESYNAERAQRFAEYQARIKEIQTNAAEQMKELAAQHQAELAEIRANRIQRIKELDAQFLDERKRRYNALIAQIRDLDASLLGEQGLRKKRQAEMIADLDAFLLNYRKKAGTLFTNPTGRQTGGYAPYGMYMLGESASGGKGRTEYVLNGSTTELAERVLGGKISQNKLATLFGILGGGTKNNIIYNDERRIDSRISNTDRQQMITDTTQAVMAALGLG